MNPATLPFLELSSLQITAGTFLVIVAIATSLFLKLDLEKDFFIASVRTTLQLLAVGYILTWIFGSNSLTVNLISLLVMSLAAAQAVTSRLKKKNWKLFWAAQAAIILGVWPLGILFVEILFNEAGYTQAAIFVPFMGVLLGNALSAISLTFLGLHRIQTENLLEIETFMSLGARSLEACQRLYRELLRQALTPILNGMTIVGIVSLPGVMAGQILGGVDPLIAAQTQILLMLLVLVTSIACSLTALGLFHIYFMPGWLHQKIKPWGFEISASIRLAVWGPSGSGKTRLLKSMNGLDHEEIRKNFFSRSELKPQKNPTAPAIYLDQKPYFIPGTVEQNLKWPFQFSRNSEQAFDSDHLSLLLRALEFSPSILNQSVQNLSGGEAQLIHLVRALLLKPEIIYLDEPTASLDSHRTALVESLLKNWLAGKSSHQLVIITHSQDQIHRFCTQTLDLKEGRLRHA